MGLGKLFAVHLSLGLFACLLQGSLLPSLLGAGVVGHSGVVPNLLVFLTVLLGFSQPTWIGSVLAFCLGLELDLASGRFLGPWAGALVVVHALIATLAQRLLVESRPTLAVAVFFSVILADIIYLGLTVPFVERWSAPFSLWEMLLAAFFTGILAPLLLGPVRWILRGRKDPIRGRGGTLRVSNR
jgi:rod shape-determining protein MreD